LKGLDGEVRAIGRRTDDDAHAAVGAAQVDMVAALDVARRFVEEARDQHPR